MAERIPESFIQDLINRSDIVELIDTYVPLKKTGANYVACCPFHNEKSPSFSVSPTKQFYHCFGCGAHGNVISFLMNYSNQAFLEAVETLAMKLGVAIPRSQQTTKTLQTHHKLYHIIEQAAEYYQQQLRQTPAAIDYLRQRGINDAMIERFTIGFASPAWDDLQKKCQQQGITEQALLASGLLIRHDKGHCYDRFRNRIMFPIRDHRGRYIGFGGRVINAADSPKYLNSPETPIFHKGSELYGLYQALQAQRQLQYVVIVEGYMDAIALAQHGLPCGVATLGTATSKQHIERLFRYTDTVIFCFDGDAAGQKAAWKGLETVLPLMNDGHQVRFMFLPENEDPDSLIRIQGQDVFSLAITHAAPLSTFFFAHITEQTDADTIDGRAKLSKLATPLLQQIPKGAFRQMMLQELAKRMRLEQQHITTLISPDLQHQASSKQNPSKTMQQSRPTPIRLAIGLLIQHPRLAQLIDKIDFLPDLPLAGGQLLHELVDYIQQNPQITTAGIVEHWRHHDNGPHIAKLATAAYLTPQQGIEKEFLDIIKYLTHKSQESCIAKLMQKAQTTELEQSEKQLLQQLISEAKA